MTTRAQARAKATGRASDEDIWRWLGEVPDPEIPVISVVDLGIVRGIGWEGDTLVVTVTPTYSGCPATRVINDEIVAHLRARGLERVRTERRLSPAWTTAWLSAAGRGKLLAYGIAPPVEDGFGCAVAAAAATSGTAAGSAPRDALAGRTTRTMSGPGSGAVPKSPPRVACPRCGTPDAERVSQFGSTPCKASYRCRGCLEPFDYFKCL